MSVVMNSHLSLTSEMLKRLGDKLYSFASQTLMRKPMAHNVCRHYAVCFGAIKDQLSRGKTNGASTFHLAKLCFNIAYPACERRVAVC